ncbi:unnamed protein product [Leptidea sinapis]|uniref:Uncharacterized protein n=1 Tax=Leptidea sinapis TaxID=189913 RepID=A0A5E4QRZ0_9NEOP|nr:unnamed protein product [Leptidea sinapis]
MTSDTNVLSRLLMTSNLRLKAQGGVAFENPSYLREQTTDTIVNRVKQPSVEDGDTEQHSSSSQGSGAHVVRGVEAGS